MIYMPSLLRIYIISWYIIKAKWDKNGESDFNNLIDNVWQQFIFVKQKNKTVLFKISTKIYYLALSLSQKKKNEVFLGDMSSSMNYI